MISEAPFYWKLMKIGMDSAKDICENVPFFQVSGSTPASPTPLYLEYLKTINKKKEARDFLMDQLRFLWWFHVS